MEVTRIAFTAPVSTTTSSALPPVAAPPVGPSEDASGINFKAPSVVDSPAVERPPAPATSDAIPASAPVGASSSVSLVSNIGTQVAARSSSAPLTETAPEPPATHAPGLDFRAVVSNAVATTHKDLSATKFVGEGLVYKLEQMMTGTTSLLGKQLSLGILHPEHDLDKLPVPKIDTPFVVVPGWRATPADYAPLVNHLTKDDANGGQPCFVKQGQFYKMGPDNKLQPLTKPPGSGKVFEMVFSDNHQAPEQNLPEMRQNLDAITHLTGASKVDALGHSMGGIDTRLYLKEGGDQVNRFLMVGTPNHGTPFGNMAFGVVNNITSWAENIGGLISDDKQSLQNLETEKDNPLLQQLDKDWPIELRHVQAAQTEANEALPTPLFGGDGLVPVSSVAMPGIVNKTHFELISHKDLTSSPKIFADMQKFFCWE